MKEIVRNINPRMIFAFLALSMLFAYQAHAQGRQALTQDKGSAPAQCAYDQLSMRTYGEVDYMGPMRYIDFIFTNTSSSPCTLEGYPRFEFLNKYERPARGGLAAKGVALMGLDREPPQLVTIEPGKTAKFFVYYLARNDESREKRCPTHRKARVTAPGTKRVFVHRFRSYPIEVCSGLGVSQVLTGAGYD